MLAPLRRAGPRYTLTPSRLAATMLLSRAAMTAHTAKVDALLAGLDATQRERLDGLLAALLADLE